MASWRKLLNRGGAESAGERVIPVEVLSPVRAESAIAPEDEKRQQIADAALEAYDTLAEAARLAQTWETQHGISEDNMQFTPGVVSAVARSAKDLREMLERAPHMVALTDMQAGGSGTHAASLPRFDRGTRDVIDRLHKQVPVTHELVQGTLDDVQTTAGSAWNPDGELEGLIRQRMNRAALRLAVLSQIDEQRQAANGHTIAL